MAGRRAAKLASDKEKGLAVSDTLARLAVVAFLWALTYLPFAMAGHYGLIPAKYAILIWLGVSWTIVVATVFYFAFKRSK